MEEQNDKRQLVINFYNEIAHGGATCDKYRWIPTEWLTNWLKGSRKADQESPKTTPPIDCSNLMCVHGKLDPLKTTKAKCVPFKASEKLYLKYGGKNELTEESLCYECVQKECKIMKFKENLEKDHKDVTEIMKNFKQM